MYLVIFANSNGTHTWMGYFHKADWETKEYRKEVEDAALKTFRRLKDKNIYPITITEVKDVESWVGKDEQGNTKKGDAVQRRRSLAERQTLVRTVTDAYKSRDTSLQEGPF